MARVAVVTGAAGGIGAATCRVLSASGWETVPVDRRPIDDPAAILIDMADCDAVEAAFTALPRVDALVNNAAVQLYKPLLETSIEEWDAVAAVNLRGPFMCLRALHRHLAESRGSVVNVASVHAHATSHSIAAYAATKGGLVAFTRAAALELAPMGIRVNTVLPGAIDTPALRDGFARRANAEADLVARTPMGRLGQPDEVASAIAYLLDDTHAGFITGASLVVDGGALARLSTE
jgi:NAD(P)-dependent dehydrogenase (short-subunit alcohol dehydrogenase family)